MSNPFTLPINFDILFYQSFQIRFTFRDCDQTINHFIFECLFGQIKLKVPVQRISSFDSDELRFGRENLSNAFFPTHVISHLIVLVDPFNDTFPGKAIGIVFEHIDNFLQ